MTPTLVVLGAMVGAPLRYLIDRAVQSRHPSLTPWGTITANTLGCLILGTLTGAALSTPWMALLGTGLCGALTTYSTFAYETLRLLERKAYRPATLNIAITLTAGGTATLLTHMTMSAILT